MRKLLLRYLVAVLVLGAWPAGCVLAATGEEESETPAREPRNITAPEWQELTNDPAYYYRDSLEFTKVTPPAPPKESSSPEFWMALMEFVNGTLGQVLIWGLLITAILYAVYRIVIGDRSAIFGKKSPKHEQERGHQDIEDITDSNWEQLLRKAEQTGDLRLSIRYSYLLLLQVLQEAELIRYRSDKTNFQYAGELADTPYKQTFRKLTRQYEYAWYGNFPVSAEMHALHMQELFTLKQLVSR